MTRCSPGGRIPAAPERPVYSFDGATATQLATTACEEDAVAGMAEHIARHAGPLAVAVGHAAPRHGHTPIFLPTR